MADSYMNVENGTERKDENGTQMEIGINKLDGKVSKTFFENRGFSGVSLEGFSEIEQTR